MNFKGLRQAALAAAALAALAPASPAAARDAIRIGTSSVGSTFYVVANGLGNLIHEHAGINASVEPIGGSHANVFGLTKGTIDYAISNAGAAYAAYAGEKPFPGKQKVWLVAQGDVSLRFILVRRDAEIATPADLKGHIMVGERPAMPEIGSVTEALLKTGGLSTSDVNVISTAETGDTEQQFRMGTVQAAIIPGGPNVTSVVQLFRDGVADALYLDDAQIAAMKAELPPFLFTRTLPAGHFQGQEKDLTVFGLNTYFVAGPDAPEDEVYAITKALFENQAEFAAFHSSAKEWTLANTLANPIVPFHPGAVRYFKEVGAWTPELEAKQQELLAAQQ